MHTVIVDENIAHIDDYLHHHDIKLIKLKGRDIDRNALIDHVPDAIFIRSVTQVNADNFGDIRQLPLKFVGSATIGTDHVDVDFLYNYGVNFANAQGCSKHSVAQYVITAILHTRPDSAHRPISLGIIGLGNIGSTLAMYAKRLGWQVMGFDPFLAPSDINNADFDDVLGCDVISTHTPLTHQGAHPTFHMIDAETFDKMNPKAMLINSARGGIIDESALLADIKRTGRQTALDVFASEPVINLELVDALTLATPHIAGYTLEGKLRGTDLIYQAFCRTFDLPIRQTLAPLLPDNPYHFDEFLAQLKQTPSQKTKEILAQYYDIAKDDADLRATCSDNGVLGDDFDYLRKSYYLRREWLA